MRPSDLLMLWAAPPSWHSCLPPTSSTKLTSGPLDTTCKWKLRLRRRYKCCASSVISTFLFVHHQCNTSSSIQYSDYYSSKGIRSRRVGSLMITLVAPSFFQSKLELPSCERSQSSQSSHDVNHQRPQASTSARPGGLPAPRSA